jgi:uncharacterized protein
MINIGAIQKMNIARKTSVGLFLVPMDEPEHEGILLPNKYIKEGFEPGTSAEVFIYRDSEGRLVAVTTVPKLKAHEIGLLKVISTTAFGAYLDWGLEKDLFLPKSEQIKELRTGDECLVYVDIDYKDKIYATMKIQKHLKSTDIFRIDDRVEGIVYKTVEGIGAFVAINDKYLALIPEKELFKPLAAGDKIQARIKDIKKDGKIDLSIRDKAYKEKINDAQMIYEYIISNGGFIEMNDKSSPARIKDIFNISKLSFKRALGKLLKEEKIVFENNGIKAKNSG